MSYRRFDLANFRRAVEPVELSAGVAKVAAVASAAREPACLGPVTELEQTVANVANVAGRQWPPNSLFPPSVADVASVAAPDREGRSSVVVTDRGPGAATLATVATEGEGASRRDILLAFERFLNRSGRGRIPEGLRVVDRFIAEHHATARRLGWNDLDLFGCHPDAAFAAVRYDYMGAVTIAALSGAPVAEVDRSTLRLQGGLAARRHSAAADAAAIWVVFRLSPPR